MENNEQNQQCPEFSYFGAKYPDARCIDGFLWDLDSYEDGCLTKGGEDPCPFCNSEEVIQVMIDNEEISTREEGIALRNEFWSKHGFVKIES